MSFSKKIAHFRKLYPSSPFMEKDLIKNPYDQLSMWLEEAFQVGDEEPNAMALATASTAGKPSSRMVLIKEIFPEGLLFFTNYESRKARELIENPYASGTLFWKKLVRQVCIEGSISKISREASEEYFINRPRGHQLGSWVSKQGAVIDSREVLEKELERLEKKYEGRPIPLPPFWGGFCLRPVRFEFWQGQPNRLHDRFLFTLQDDTWHIHRLAP